MEKVKIGDLELWQFDSLKNEKGINHFVSERNSAGDDTVFTISLSSTPDKDLVIRNRSKLAVAMGVNEDRLYLPSQVHKTRILRVTSKTTVDELMDTDALITNEPGICIAVMSADCVPVLLYDRTHHAVAAIHSGWKGTALKIVEKTLNAMHTNFGTTAQDLIACIGPSVCQASYEVGGEVINAFNDAYGDDAGLMIAKPEAKAMLDLWKANTLQLLKYGIPEGNIELSDLCTVKNNNHFFSARQGDSGRFAAGIVLSNIRGL